MNSHRQITDPELLEAFYNDSLVQSLWRRGASQEEIIVAMFRRHKEIMDALVQNYAKNSENILAKTPFTAKVKI